MAEKGIIIEDLLLVRVTFHIQYSLSFFDFFPSLVHTTRGQDVVKTKGVTTDKINICYIWNKVTVQSLFPVEIEMSQSPGF